MHLLLLSELVAALRANDPGTFKQWLADGVHELGEPGVAELMVEWMVPLLTQDEADRLVGCQAGALVLRSEPLNLSHCSAFAPL